MSKTRYQVSDASVRRFKQKVLEELENGDYNNPMGTFNEWATEEGFSKYTYWDALTNRCKEDKQLLADTLFEFKQTKDKLDQITSAFSVINELTK
jgi:hypothetical protein